MSNEFLPLAGKTALVTGVSRRRGIGFTVASELAKNGANVFIQHWRPHDLEQPWGGDDLDQVRSELRECLISGARFGDIEADLADSASCRAVFEAAQQLTGEVDILVCNQAKSGDDGSILDMNPARLDAFWDINTRATLLLTAEFARSKQQQADSAPARPGDRVQSSKPFAEPTGKVFWLTSGQLHGPMRGEVAYAASKAALAGVTATVAAELLDLGVILNTINPGPVNTGYMDPETSDRDVSPLEDYLATMPFGRFGQPSDAANLIAWLASDRGSWVAGQVITSDGGFSIS